MTQNIDKLKNRDYVLAFDHSGSMTEKDTSTGQSRFEYAQESTLAIARKLNEYDPDGIGIIPFSSSAKLFDNVTPDKVKDIFAEHEPMGGTRLAPVIALAYKSFQELRKNNSTKQGLTLMVITDGQPQDEEEVANSIVNITKQLDNEDGFRIDIVQVGKDNSATNYLKRLDTGLKSKGAKWDIVSVVTIDELGDKPLAQTLLDMSTANS